MSQPDLFPDLLVPVESDHPSEPEPTRSDAGSDPTEVISVGLSQVREIDQQLNELRHKMSELRLMRDQLVQFIATEADRAGIHDFSDGSYRLKAKSELEVVDSKLVYERVGDSELVQVETVYKVNGTKLRAFWNSPHRSVLEGLVRERIVFEVKPEQRKTVKGTIPPSP